MADANRCYGKRHTTTMPHHTHTFIVIILINITLYHLTMADANMCYGKTHTLPPCYATHIHSSSLSSLTLHFIISPWQTPICVMVRDTHNHHATPHTYNHRHYRHYPHTSSPHLDRRHCHRDCNHHRRSRSSCHRC